MVEGATDGEQLLLFDQLNLGVAEEDTGDLLLGGVDREPFQHGFELVAELHLPRRVDQSEPNNKKCDGDGRAPGSANMSFKRKICW